MLAAIAAPAPRRGRKSPDRNRAHGIAPIGATHAARLSPLSGLWNHFGDRQTWGLRPTLCAVVSIGTNEMHFRVG